MTETLLKPQNDSVLECELGDLFHILFMLRKANEEKVIAIAKLGEHNILTLSKKHFSRGFTGLSGFQRVQGCKNVYQPGEIKAG